MRGRILGTEEALTALHAAHRKLAGRIYADEGHKRPQSGAVPDADPGEVCPNYARAQLEGPFSDAARCECEFCERKRAERDVLRAQFAPKPVKTAKVKQ